MRKENGGVESVYREEKTEKLEVNLERRNQITRSE